MTFLLEVLFSLLILGILFLGSIAFIGGMFNFGDFEPKIFNYIIPIFGILLICLFFYICSNGDKWIEQVYNTESVDYQNNTVENYFIKDGYYYFELEGIDSYIKIPADEINVQ